MSDQAITQTAKLTAPRHAAFEQGIVCGVLGAVAIAVWFFIADLVQGQALHTPSVLGNILFSLLQGRGAITSPELIPVSLKMVMVFTIIHGTVFAAIGIILSNPPHRAEGDPAYGLALMLLFLIFGTSFIFLNMVIAGVVLNAPKITGILIANLPAAGTMGAYLKRRHQGLIVHE